MHSDGRTMKSRLLRENIRALGKVGCRGRVSEDELFIRLQADGGHDTEDLTAQDIANLLDERAPEDWCIATFAFSEVVSFYLVTAHNMSFQQVIAAAFSACVLADAARAGECDWSMEHDKIMALCAILAGRMELEAFLHLMAYIFGKGGQPPIRE
jgi:hypothetical protein